MAGNESAWRPVRLEIWDEARIETFRVDQEDLSDAEARIAAKLDIVADTPGRTTVHAVVTGPDGKTVTVDRSVTLADGIWQITITERGEGWFRGTVTPDIGVEPIPAAWISTT